jgi:hypothetical protein
MVEGYKLEKACQQIAASSIFTRSGKRKSSISERNGKLRGNRARLGDCDSTTYSIDSELI